MAQIHCKPSGSKPWFNCRSPIHHLRASAQHKMFLLVLVAALPLEAFPGEGNAEHSPTYPRNCNCIFLRCPCRVFWEGWDPEDPVQRDKPVPAPTWKLKAIAQQPPSPHPFPEASFCSPLTQPLPKAWRRSCPHVRQSCLSYLRTQGFSCCIPTSRGLPMQAGVRLLLGAGVQQGGVQQGGTPAAGWGRRWEPAPPQPSSQGSSVPQPHHCPFLAEPRRSCRWRGWDVGHGLCYR